MTTQLLARSELDTALRAAGPTAELNTVGRCFQQGINATFTRRLDRSQSAGATDKLVAVIGGSSATAPCITALLARSYADAEPVRLTDAVASHLLEVLRPGTSCAVGDFPLAEVVMERIRGELPDYSPAAMPVEVATDRAGPEMARLAEAVELVRSCDGYGAELDTFVRIIVPIAGRRVRHSSHAAGYGAMFVNVSVGLTVIELFDAVVHELGHHALLAACSFDPLLSNGSVLGRSPLRTDPRPLISILHASYVLVRVADALDALWNLPEVEGALAAAAAARAVASRRLAADALSELERHGARWTGVGEVVEATLVASTRSVGSRVDG